jgi:prepilin-type processing-associated H-X9-DG protein/prepilin-type N-terminal cleavage/methylation domain-containing protein
MKRSIARAGIRRGAFTLVELLIVIGIVAILIALLLVVINRARAAANSARCRATLRTIGHAAEIHAMDHKGFFPVAGWHFAPTGGRCDPTGLDDPLERRYTYYTDADIHRPAPVTIALARSLGMKIKFDSRPDVEAELRRPDLIRLLHCEAQSENLSGMTQREDGPWIGPVEYSSYLFNEAVLGRRDITEDRPRFLLANSSKVKRASTVMLAIDGRPRNMTTDNWLLVFERGPEDTLYTFQQLTSQPNGWGKESLDYRRHRGMINVLYIDGHVDSVPMTPDGLKSIGVSYGIRDR